MHPLLKKLQVKAQDPLLVVQAPEAFAETLEAWREDKAVHLDGGDGDQPFGFFLAFVQSEEDIVRTLPVLRAKVAKEALVWYAYPKKSSRRYAASISRDQGWQALGALGFEPVRQVAIDEDWSALRFRPAGQIRTMTRDPKMALSKEGKKRTRDREKNT